MNDQAPHLGRSEKRSGGRLFEGNPTTGRTATWERVDSELEVRARLVVIADSIESGDIRMAELCVLQLLDDLDGVAFLLGRAA
jgi:hypothetical protein